ncbi:MAG: PA14 domain-containing protein [Limisphaerales bacterium]
MKFRAVRRLLLAASAAVTLGPAQAQEVLLQEGFNTDGTTANPPRYILTGQEAYEPQRIRDELSNFDQKGPIYWDHSFKVSYAGNPQIPGRRAIFGWRGVDASLATEDLLKLFDSTIDWLLAGKQNARIFVNPNVAAIQGLGDRLAAAGHVVADDDTASFPNDFEVEGDLFIHGPGANNPSRFVLRTEPVLVMNSPDYDDMLVGSIGTATLFTPGQVTITTPGHPAAGGKTGSFNAFTGEDTFELVGSFPAPGAINLATVTRIVPPSVSSLADVDAMVAGTKQHEKTDGQLPVLDISDASSGQWFDDYPLPGDYTGNWGMVANGKLSVPAAGTYRFALGSDDGARLLIDLDRNGVTAADMVIEDAGPHAHQIVYVNVAFPASGTYDFQVASYNSAGGGSVELSVPIVAGEVPDDALDSGYWELFGTDGGSSPVRAVGAINVTGYRATGADVERQEPLVVLLNGPSDTPPGSFYDGGPMNGFEGTGFLGGSGLNKWPYPDGLTYRSVQLNPVNVTGKQNVRIVVALAATVVDFEDSDFIDVVYYPDGLSSTPVVAAHFRGVQNAIQPWLADANDQFSRRLTRTFADFTYSVPATARNLIVEIRAATSWWTEIVAIDNIRVLAGEAANTGQPTELGKTVNGYQDDFTGAVRNPDWKVRGPGGDYYSQADGLLRVSARSGDPNHLLYEAAGYHTNVQEVLARIRITAFGTNDAARAGLGVGVATNNSQGINLHFRNHLQDNVAGRQFKLLDDARAWGPAGLKTDWETNKWYWLRLRQDPNAGGGTDDVFGKAWLADGATAEPTDWQLKWDYNPTRTVRSGFAGITACSIDGVGTFEVDYILIKAEGLPSIQVNFEPLGPAPTTPRFTSVTKTGNNVGIQWIGAGILQQAADASGPWTDVTGNAAITPSVITPNAANPNKIYRLRP